jgi:hypothetical protein
MKINPKQRTLTLHSDKIDGSAPAFHLRFLKPRTPGEEVDYFPTWVIFRFWTYKFES